MSYVLIVPQQLDVYFHVNEVIQTDEIIRAASIQLWILTVTWRLKRRGKKKQMANSIDTTLKLT